MFSGHCSRGGIPPLGLVLAGLLLAGMTGCGASNPFDMAPVQGKITYEDGSVISGDRIEVEFTPQGEAIGNMTPKPGKANVSMADGTFTDVTTLDFNDGLIVGQHQVEAVLYDARGKATDLTVVESEITIQGGQNELAIRVKKP